MTLSKGSIETLIDLVEIKLGCFEVYDRDDKRALMDLERCLRELEALSGGDKAAKWAGDANNTQGLVRPVARPAH